MRIHSSSVVTIVVTLLFVSGTVGCRSNGGAWYNPKSYTWTNPFAKSNEAPPYAADSSANPKPSLDSNPNIDSPQGGYTDGTSSYASRSGMQSGTPGNLAAEHSGSPSLAAAQGTSNPYGGGYSIAETSQYPPPYTGGQSSLTGTANPYQYPVESAQSNQIPSQYPTTAAPIGTTSYGNSDYSAGTQQYHQTSVVNHPTTPLNQTSNNSYGVTSPVVTNSPAAGNNYAPFESTSAAQNDPYAPATQQPVPASPAPAGGYYEQAVNPQPTSVPPPAGNYYDQPMSAPQQPYSSVQPSQSPAGYGY